MDDLGKHVSKTTIELRHSRPHGWNTGDHEYQELDQSPVNLFWMKSKINEKLINTVSVCKKSNEDIEQIEAAFLSLLKISWMNPRC